MTNIAKKHALFTVSSLIWLIKKTNQTHTNAYLRNYNFKLLARSLYLYSYKRGYTHHPRNAHQSAWPIALLSKLSLIGS